MAIVAETFTDDPCKGLSPPTRTGPWWLSRCLFPFAGRRRSSAVTPPELGSTGPEKAAASDALPASPKAVATADAKLAQVPQKVPPLVMASRAAAWSETARDSPETAPSPDDLRAAGAASVLAVSSVAEPAAVSSSTPAFPSSGSNTIVDGRKSSSESARPAGAVSSTSTPTAVPPERGSLPPPPSPWAPPALGTAAGVPAEDLPSWWTGSAVPMELLEEEEPGLSCSAGSDAEVKIDTVPCESPSLRQDGIVDEEAPRQPSRSPELRPRSYRNSSRSKEQSGQRGISPIQKLEKGEKISRVSTSSSSRPTTAGAESAANSAYSTSWRQEWNPSNDLSPAERAAPSSLQPLPSRSNKPPPLPPLPMRPPESGSVLSINSASTGAALAPPPPAGKPTASWEANPSSTDAGALVVDESALRRLCSSANAKVATPPPMAKRREVASPSGTAMPRSLGDDRDDEAPSNSKGGEAVDLAVEPDAEGATATPTSLDESPKHDNLALDETKTSNFSELARSFAYMDMLA